MNMPNVCFSGEIRVCVSFLIHFKLISLITLSHYENTPIQKILKILQAKMDNFQMKILILFIFLLKTDCGYSLEWPQ